MNLRRFFLEKIKYFTRSNNPKGGWRDCVRGGGGEGVGKIWVEGKEKEEEEESLAEVARKKIGRREDFVDNVKSRINLFIFLVIHFRNHLKHKTGNKKRSTSVSRGPP